MFQSSKQRETAEDKHICEDCCNNTKNCIFKPDSTSWMYILTFCQRFNQELNYSSKDTERLK